MRILVVEAEPRLLFNQVKAWREEGSAEDAAEAGDDGLFKAETCDYDAVVLDVMLPELDGCEVWDRLRKHKRPLAGSPRPIPGATLAFRAQEAGPDLLMVFALFSLPITGALWMIGVTKGRDRRPHLGEMMGGGRR